jgi:hypothetical protein
MSEKYYLSLMRKGCQELLISAPICGGIFEQRQQSDPAQAHIKVLHSNNAD